MGIGDVTVDHLAPTESIFWISHELKRSGEFSIHLLNSCSLTDRIRKLRTVAADNSSDIMPIAEAYLPEHSSTGSFLLTGYSPCQTTRSNSRFGGIPAYLK